MERTFVMIKPDAVKRHLAGEVISRLEKRNFNIIAMKMLLPSIELAKEHYKAHKDQYFYPALIEYLSSGAVVAMVLECENAITLARQTIGATNPLDAVPGTIRGDLTVTMRENLVHGSDSPEAAEYEIKLWFPEI